MINRLLEEYSIKDEYKKNIFVDIDNHWAKDEISKASILK